MSKATRRVAIGAAVDGAALSSRSCVLKPRLSQPGEGHKLYPYLLNGVAITRSTRRGSTDITYIRMTEGFVYLVAVMDWFSRYVLNGRVADYGSGFFA